MVRAVWNGVVLAEAPKTVRVEGNHYFPPETVNWSNLEASPTRTICPWKGKARYYTVRVDGQDYPDAAWQYEKPTFLAKRIRGHVAFYGGVEISA